MADFYLTEVRCSGRVFHVGRSLDLTRRVEGVLGPIGPLAERLEKGDIEQASLVALYAAILKDETDVPDREDIARWVYDAGTYYAARQVAFFVLSLIIGNDAAMKMHDRIQRSRDMKLGTEPEEREPGPFSPMAGSTTPI